MIFPGPGLKLNRPQGFVIALVTTLLFICCEKGINQSGKLVSETDTIKTEQKKLKETVKLNSTFCLNCWILSIRNGKIKLEWNGNTNINLSGEDINSEKKLMIQLKIENGPVLGMDSPDSGNLLEKVGLEFKQDEIGKWVLSYSDNFTDPFLAGEVINIEDGFTIDITTCFEEGRLDLFLGDWIANGAEGIVNRELAAASTVTFFKLIRGEVENIMIDNAVYDENGWIDFEKTKEAFDIYYESLKAALESDKLLNQDAGTFESEGAKKDVQDELTYRERFNELFKLYKDFLTFNVGIVDSNKDITEFYGPIEGLRYDNHKGMDFFAFLGDPYYAGFDGIIDGIQYDTGGNSGYGNLVVINHGFMFEDTFCAAGFMTRHGHMNEIETGLEEGLFVNSNDMIGYAGSTGYSEGFHDHFGLSYLADMYPVSRILTEMLKMATDRTGWKFEEDYPYRFYDPENLYKYWFGHYGSNEGITIDLDHCNVKKMPLSDYIDLHYSEEEQKRIVYLTAGDAGLEKIAGLERLVNLKTLLLIQNNISKIENLNHLVHLETLRLRFNHIKKIEGLETLENLRVLDLTYNEIEEIAGLESLKNLEEFEIAENLLRDYSGLLVLKGLKYINIIGDNHIQDERSKEILKKVRENNTDAVLLGFDWIDE